MVLSESAALMADTVMSVGTPENIVGVISKLLTDLVARNDQARSRSARMAHLATVRCDASGMRRS